MPVFMQPEYVFKLGPLVEKEDEEDEKGEEENKKEDWPIFGLVKEESGYWGRCWSWMLPGFRPTTYAGCPTPCPAPLSRESAAATKPHLAPCVRYTVRRGEKGDGPLLMTHSKGRTCPFTIEAPISEYFPA
jgi:hypothetical protein